jgi:hypothetical protein
MATCNPDGDCIAFLDAKVQGYVDPKWQEHLLAHGREEVEDDPAIDHEPTEE